MATLLLCATGVAQQPGPGRSVAQSLRNNVVNIEVTRGNQTIHGSGVIIGQRDRTIFIVTARHVVASKGRGDGGETPAIAVEYFADRGKRYEARLLALRQPNLDLAVLEAPAPPTDLDWRRDVLARDEYRAGDPVWYVSAPYEWDVPALAGAIHSRDEIAHTLRAEFNRVLRGTSGGPLVTGSGIVGIAVSDYGEEIEAIPVETVESVVEDWGKPWDLAAHARDGPDPAGANPQKNGETTPPASAVVKESGYRFRALGCEAPAGEVVCIVSIENLEEKVRRLQLHGHSNCNQTIVFDDRGNKLCPEIAIGSGRPTQYQIQQRFVPGVPVNVKVEFDDEGLEGRSLTLLLVMARRGESGQLEEITLRDIPVEGRAPPNSDPPDAMSEVSQSGYRFRALGCEAPAGEVVCTVSIENLEEKVRRLQLHGHSNCNQTIVFDDRGNKLCPEIAIGSGNPTQYQLLQRFVPGVPVNVKVEFDDEGLEGRSLTLLLVMARRGESGQLEEITLRDIPVEGRAPPNSDPPDAMSEASQSDYRFRALGCEAPAGEVLCTVSIENLEEKVRRLQIHGHSNCNQTIVFDDRGNKLCPEVAIGSGRPTQYQIQQRFVPGVPVNVKVEFDDEGLEGRSLTLVLVVTRRDEAGRREEITLRDIPVEGRGPSGRSRRRGLSAQ